MIKDIKFFEINYIKINIDEFKIYTIAILFI